MFQGMIVPWRSGLQTGTVLVTGASEEELEIFKNWPVLQAHIGSFDHANMELKEMQLQSIDIVGKDAKRRTLFAKVKMTIADRATGNPISGIAFLRGGAVCVFLRVTVKETGKKYMIRIRQPRAPIGQYRFPEVIAGMDDKAAGIAGQAIKELAEETGITMSASDLTYLGTMVPSAGGSDEAIACFGADMEIEQSKLDAVLAKMHGAVDENETILVDALTPAEFVKWLSSDTRVDAKALSALMFWLLKTQPDAIVALLEG